MNMPSEYTDRLARAAEAEEAKQALDLQLARLRRLTLIMNFTNLSLVASTFLLVIAAMIICLARGNVIQTGSYSFRDALQGNITDPLHIIIWGLGNLSLAVYHAALSKQGGVVFDEISEELHWHVRTQRSRAEATVTNGEQRPGIKTRIALRTYMQNTELLLVPGAFGPAVYAAVNVLIPLTVIILLLQRH